MISKYTAPEMANSALITIDTQCDCLEGQPFAVSGTDEILPRMKRLLNAFRAAGRPIVHMVRLYRPDGSDVDLCRKALVERGQRLFCPATKGCQLAPALLPQPAIRLDEDLLLAGKPQPIAHREVIIYKPRWGAFYRTCLEKHLRHQSVSTLVFSGCNFPNCPRTSIYQASERDFRIVVVQDALSGLYERGQNELLSIGVRLVPTNHVVAALEGREKI